MNGRTITIKSPTRTAVRVGGGFISCGPRERTTPLDLLHGAFPSRRNAEIATPAARSERLAPHHDEGAGGLLAYASLSS